MFIFEILVIIVLGAFIANGYRAGAIETLGRLLGSVFGFLAARSYSGWLVGILGFFMPQNWAYLTAFVLIFLVVDQVIGFVFKLGETLFKVITKLPVIKQIDSLLGGVFGFFEAVIVLGGVSWLLHQSALALSGTGTFTTLKTVGLVERLFQLILNFLL